jgi:hypothetical protein
VDIDQPPAGRCQFDGVRSPVRLDDVAQSRSAASTSFSNASSVPQQSIRKIVSQISPSSGRAGPRRALETRPPSLRFLPDGQVTPPGAMPIGVGCRQRHGVRVLACRCRWRDAQHGPGWTPCKSHGCRKFRGPSTRCPPIGNASWKLGTLATMQRWANGAAISSGGSAGWSRRIRQSCEPRGARPSRALCESGPRGVCCSRDTQITTGSTCGRREARHSRLVIEAVPASRCAGSVLPARAREICTKNGSGALSVVT